MKHVSLKIAKAIKEAGFPQYGHCEEFYDSHGNIVDKMCDMSKLVFPRPTYIELWLWLWREKNINIKDTRDGAVWIWVGDNPSIYLQVSRDPEEAIVTAIEYLVNNKLLK